MLAVTATQNPLSPGSTQPRDVLKRPSLYLLTNQSRRFFLNVPSQGGRLPGHGRLRLDGELSGFHFVAVDDFSLRAIIAHERGHQVLTRHPFFAGRMAKMPAVIEEVLASLIGARLVGPGPDGDMLVDKAAAELLDAGASVTSVTRQIERWQALLRELL